MIGAQTIGNATLVAYDHKPILSTDPWLGSNDFAYFGSWCLSYEIPEKIKKDIFNSEYIFFASFSLSSRLEGILLTASLYEESNKKYIASSLKGVPG